MARNLRRDLAFSFGPINNEDAPLREKKSLAKLLQANEKTRRNNEGQKHQRSKAK
jgi:hypothetical protein